jgi:histidinol dehydrogenase
VVLVNHLEEAIGFANEMAPEHLELHLKNAGSYIPRLKHYGSLFIGEKSAEILGDYSSGINHILPTNSAARYTGGLGVKDFIKIQTSLRVTQSGIMSIGPVVKRLAEAEGLEAHAKSIWRRIKNNKKS